jgi:hypothetical protein
MVVETSPGRRKGRRWIPAQIPDPLRAHGAWVYLIVSILAGVLTVTDRGLAPALLAGSGFVGVYVLASSLAIARRRAALVRMALGLLVAIGSPLLALAQGADPRFLMISLVAFPPVLCAAYFASRQGFLAPGALAFGVTALVVSAPVAASAGGASPRSALLLLATLVPFFFWRTWRLARALGPGWTRERFERRGLRESGLAAAWATLAVTTTRMLG